jgi:hypothetical protein
MLIPRAGDAPVASSAGTRWHKMGRCKHGETAWSLNTGDVAVQCSPRRQDTFCAVIESSNMAYSNGYTACYHLQASPVSCHVTRPQMRASSAMQDGQRPLIDRARSQVSEPSAKSSVCPFSPSSPLPASLSYSVLAYTTCTGSLDRRAPGTAD